MKIKFLTIEANIWSKYVFLIPLVAEFFLMLAIRRRRLFEKNWTELFEKNDT